MPKPVPNSLLPLPCWLPAVACLAGLLAFARTFPGGFLGDDFVYVARFHDLSWAGWLRLFSTEWSDGVWGVSLRELRPVAALTLMVDARLWGDAAWGYRLTNFAVFGASITLVTALAWHYSGGRRTAAIIAGLLFALHPVQAEPVAWIIGRVDLLAVCAVLFFWWSALHYCSGGRPVHLAAVFLALLSGVFSKELCLLALPLLVLAWVVLPDRFHGPGRRRVLVVAAALLALAIYAVCRHLAFGALAATPMESLAAPGAWARQASYFAWLFPWAPYSHQIELHHPPAPALVGLGCAGLVAAVIAGLGLTRRNESPVARGLIFFGGIWWIGTVLTLVFVSYFSPRHLHFGSVGLCLAAGLGLAGLPRPWLRGHLAAAAGWWLVTAQCVTVTDWAEAGALSRTGHAALRTAAETPAPPVLVFAVPGQWRTAWFWSWAAPHLAAAPFMAPAGAPPVVVGSPANYYLPGQWAQKAAGGTPEALRAAGRVFALHVGNNGRQTARLVEGEAVLCAADELSSMLEQDAAETSWDQWVQRLASP